MRRNITILTIIMVLTSMAAFAAGTTAHESGRNTWKKNCRIACHSGDADGSPVLSPDSKTQNQWKNNFKDERVYIMKFHTKETFKNLTDKDWELIYDFVYHHAHDSDNPEDCMGNKGELVN